MERETRKEREGMEKTRKDGGIGARSGFAWLFSVDGIRGLARKLFAGIIVVCMGMWGCSSWFEDDTHFEWAEHRTEQEIVGFVDDSLVITYNARAWYERTDEDDDQVGRGEGNQAIFIYNYRVQLDGPVFIDSLDNGMEKDFNYGLGQLSDSVIWGGNVNHLTRKMGNVFSFWKIGEKPHKMEIKKNFDGCKFDFGVEKMREWLNGSIYVQSEQGNLNAGGDTCQYAVLDTNEQKITYKRLDDELKWIEKCDDVRAWGEDVYCLALLNEPMNLYLIKNDIFLDTLLQGMPYEWVSYTKVGFSGSILNLGNNIFKIMDDKLFSNGVAIRNALEYKLENGNYITY